MLPKVHIFYGAILTLMSWYLFDNITLVPAFLLFFGSVFIDFDHYMWYVIKKKDWNLKRAYYYLKDKIHEPKQLMLFHTVEFLIFIGLLAFVWFGFYYILVGMLYHSALDIIDMNKYGGLKLREFSLINWYIKKRKSI